MNEEDLTVEEALAMLPAGDTVHTFMNPANMMLLGADWDRADVEQVIRETDRRILSGPIAKSMNHGLVLWHEPTKDWLFVETKPESP